MSFAERNEHHEAHLPNVIKALRARGWRTEETGCERWSDAERAMRLRRWPGLLARWWPDLEARRGIQRRWVDAKADGSETENYSVELAALACYGMIEARERARVVLVWPGGACNFTADLIPFRVETGIPTRGSGTAFALVRKADQRSFDDVFGPPP